MATLVAYVTEQTATTTPTQGPLLVHFSPLMAGDHQTREILKRVFGAYHVDGPVGSKEDGKIHGISCQYKSAKLRKEGRYLFQVRQQAGLILDPNMVPVLLLAIFEEPVIFIVIAIEKPNTLQYFRAPRLDGQMRVSIFTRDVRFCHGRRPIRRIARCAARVRSATDDHRRPDDRHQSA